MKQRNGNRTGGRWIQPALRGGWLLSWLSLAGGVGCGAPLIRPDLTLLTDPNAPVYRDQDWETVLSRFVKDGLVDYDGLSAQREPLERYYALSSVTGPTKTPDQFAERGSATAYWINVYNALVLRAVLEKYPVASMYTLDLPRLEHGYTFQVAGRVMTLASVEQEMLTSSKGDVRTLFATSRAAMGTPRLGSEPFRGAGLESQLAAATVAALDNSDLLHVDHTRQVILVWQLVLRRQDDFISYWRRTRRAQTTFVFNVLLELASPERKRAMQSGVGYALRAIPFNRGLNRTTSPGERPIVP